MISLVAGATGFAGINIVEALLERGDEVVAFGHTALPDNIPTYQIVQIIYNSIGVFIRAISV